MPWEVSDVDKYNKGLTDKQKRQWVAVANGSLASCLEDGGSEEDCAAKAIQQANGVVKEDEGMSRFEKWIKALQNAERLGENKDDPEGARYIQMSETLVQELIADLQEMAQNPDVRGLLTQALALLEEAETDMAESEAQVFAESESGHAIGLAEAAEDNGNRAPVEFDLKIIAPGAGNSHDRHWYPAEMLRRDAHVFEGVDMFVTDHRENERSERTKAGKIKSIVGFDEDGGPIGRAVVYDPDLAEKIRNRAVAGELETLHCSILASGTAKKGEIDGKKYHIVEAISSASAVDLVSRAGAGGKALALAESENGGEPMTEEEQVIEEQETEPTEEPLEEVTLQEQQEDEPEESPPEPAMLDQEQVKQIVGESNLPDASKARLSETAYADEGSVEAAIKAEIAYVKELTGSGKPFAQGAGDPVPEHKPRTVEEADADFKRILAEVGMPHLGG